ncbi:MAG TPA: hypothetical protein PKE16_01970, partial [Hyphomicrobium sp.]|nr:hypothetical protein [Hyphomicrobium sp.]
MQIPDQPAPPPPGAQALPLEAGKSRSGAAEKPAAHPEASVAAELKHEDAPTSAAVASSDEPAAPPPAAQNTSKAIDGIALGNRPPARDTNLAPEQKQAAAEAPSTVPAPSLAPALPPVPAQSDHP